MSVSREQGSDSFTIFKSLIFDKTMAAALRAGKSPAEAERIAFGQYVKLSEPGEADKPGEHILSGFRQNHWPR